MALYSEDHVAGEQEPVYPINAVRNRALQMVETQVRQPMPRSNLLQMGVHTVQQSIIWGTLPFLCMIHPAATAARAACPCDWCATSKQAVDHFSTRRRPLLLLGTVPCAVSSRARRGESSTRLLPLMLHPKA